MLLFALVLSGHAFATDYYWVATSAGNWGTASNWSTTSGGSGGSSLPGSSDRAIFDENSTGACTLTSTKVIKNVELRSDFTGTVSLNANVGFQINNDLIISGGTMSFPAVTSSRLAVLGSFTINGGTYQASGFETRVDKNFTFTSGSFLHNGGRFTFRQGATVATVTGPSGQRIIFNDLMLQAQTTNFYRTISSGTELQVDGEFSVTGYKGARFLGGNVYLYGDVDLSAYTNTGNPSQSTTVFHAVGTGDQTFTGGTNSEAHKLGGLTINKPSGTLFLNGFIAITWNYNYIQGNVAAGTTAADRITFVRSGQVNGTHALHNVAFSGAIAGNTYALGSGTELTVNGNLLISNSNYVRINTGSVLVHGDVTLNNGNDGNSGTGYIKLVGTGNQTMTGKTSGPGYIPASLMINKPSGTLTMADQIGVNAAWTTTQGTIDPGNSTVHFIANNFVHGIPLNLNNVTLNKQGGTLNTLTIASSISVNNLTYAEAHLVNGGELAVNGNIDLAEANANAGGTGTISLTGTSDQTLYSPLNHYVLPNLKVDKASGDVLLDKDLMIADGLDLQNGNIISTAAAMPTFKLGATVIDASVNSFIKGPARKLGNEAFVFPLGDTEEGILYGPIGIGAPSLTSSSIVAEYIGDSPDDDAVTGNLREVSECEYWSLESENGTENLEVNLHWDDARCMHVPEEDRVIAKWNGTAWEDIASSILTSNGGTGQLKGSASISLSQIFTLGNVNKQYRPYAQLRKKLDGSFHRLHAGYFLFEYNNQYAETALIWNLYSDHNTLLASNVTHPTAMLGPDNLAGLTQGDVAHGNNLMRLDLTCAGVGVNQGYYVLEIINEKKEKEYVRIYRSTPYSCTLSQSAGGGN